MANEIITTLHPDQNPDTNLYPNIKKDNIPNGSIDRSKLDDGVNNLLDSINELHPSGVDTSTNILAFTTNKGIYIGSDTGHWYYWDRTQYVDGGVYQATQIADNSILPSMTKFFTSRGVNLFNRWSVILGYFRGSWDGVLHENNAYYASDFIPVNANTIYSLGGLTANAHISFFDTNKNYISGLVSQSNSTITTPNDCVYMCMSDQLSTLDTMIIENSTSYNSAYYDFYKLFDNLINIKDLSRILIVDITGKNGAYKSLSKACYDAQTGDTILVMPGDYIDESCNCWGKKINIIGVNKDTCKIATSVSTYQAPMFNIQIGMIANLSILLSNGNGYCIHSEWDDQVDNTLIISNCNIISNTGTCIGCGMRKGYSLIIENCYIENKSNGACILIHDAYDDQYIGDMYPTIINCELIANEEACLVIQSQEKQGTIVHLTIEKTSMITNATHTYRVVNYEGGTSTDPDDFLGCINWRLDKRSWGNREDTYNYDEQ